MAPIIVAWPRGLGCKALGVTSPNAIQEALDEVHDHGRATGAFVPEFITERFTNVAKGTEIHNINDF